MVKEAHKALGAMNKGRLAYPQRNNYQLKTASTDNEGQFVPELGSEKLAAAEMATRGVSSNESAVQQKNSQSFAYTVSPQLSEAARIVAEASQPPLPGDHGINIANVLERRPKTYNDTNRPQQKHRRPNGLDGYVYDDPATLVDHNKPELKKRGSSDFWLTTMAQRGSSPYAPAGYKIWRNVKDYGAKGDGITDDTAAINLAISEGGRCGANCGSSTTHPAFIYFPSGTYLVSSSIIQYYNTEFFGNPFDYPTILAASSFVGLGVITSDVYTGDTEEWYLNTNNFLRSVRNFKIDVTRTNSDAYVCGIHWQVAQGTSLENIVFYMVQDDVTTQQGIYMENGSGGFLTNLTFVGGNFGAYFGNQQFTTSQLTFLNCKNALQVHWDWAWTMQDVIIEDCINGLVIVGGYENIYNYIWAGGPASTGQSVGSLILMDVLIYNTKIGIMTSLFSENSTSFLLQNANFINVDIAVMDSSQGRILLAGGSQVITESWGFWSVATSSTNSTFYNGQNIPTMDRPVDLTSPGYFKWNFFQRRRPAYTDIGTAQIIDVKEFGAVGDGVTDDGPILNSILDRAANISAIVFIPYGVYVIKDTLHVPVGSRIMGQTWSQIMATGSKFQDELQPRVAVQVGKPGDVGIVEMQSLMFTVSGPTAGAVLVEWNVHQSTQGSAAIWDSHFRVGGATGSNLQATQCPKLSGTINTKCQAASLMLHLTPQSSAYMENIWAWTADHDLDLLTQDQITVYSGRGILIESQGPTWMYGTSSEHNVLYQYQISTAKQLYMSMIQTESPYFQPVPEAPQPFSTGLFPNDPSFSNCDANPSTCAISWALRILDSSSVYIMGAANKLLKGLYSFFYDYSQKCLDTGNCQQRAVEISESTDTWIYNLVTKEMIEMVSPVNETPTLGANNVNGFMSSILAWIREKNNTIGERKFPGFQLYKSEWLDDLPLTGTCKTALTQNVLCHPWLKTKQSPGIGQYFENTTYANEICDSGCGDSLHSWYDNVSKYCGNQTVGDSRATRKGGIIYASYNLTCLKDQDDDQYCNQVINGFTTVPRMEEMTLTEMCSYCFTTLFKMRQASDYAAYSTLDQENLQIVNQNCGLDTPIDLHDSLWIEDPTPKPVCASDTTYTTMEGDTCDKIANEYQVASAAIIFGNSGLIANCSALYPGKELCIPLSCDVQYTVKDNDDCVNIEYDLSLRPGTIRKYNPWLETDCTDLQSSREIVGSVLCLSPQGGVHNSTGASLTKSPGGSGYSKGVSTSPGNSTIAVGTTQYCGLWYTATAGDSCVSICLKQSIPSNLFLSVNPSLSREDCDADLADGITYCVAPDVHWDDPSFWATSSVTTSSIAVSSTPVA
ncbi:pectin lyase-like protein [Penicillium mononematosum]|uniref:pectin lyase-like protein n=1 Tax=Penicillium mononematosum TaxID=268346 RepID=UPI00254815BF|nr:pectin lyase-like protein [Penicillium mononematosum]KAJ6191605.1 pectin lyase-like protein [Penicillium mononematosum]